MIFFFFFFLDSENETKTYEINEEKVHSYYTGLEQTRYNETYQIRHDQTILGHVLEHILIPVFAIVEDEVKAFTRHSAEPNRSVVTGPDSSWV